MKNQYFITVNFTLLTKATKENPAKPFHDGVHEVMLITNEDSLKKIEQRVVSELKRLAELQYPNMKGQLDIAININTIEYKNRMSLITDKVSNNDKTNTKQKHK